MLILTIVAIVFCAADLAAVVYVCRQPTVRPTPLPRPEPLPDLYPTAKHRAVLIGGSSR